MDKKVLVECGRGHVFEVKEEEVYTPCPICNKSYRNKNSMKIYIASGFDSIVQVKYIEEELRKLNHTIVSSWHEEQQTTKVGNAIQDLYEIGQANWIIFLTYTKSTKGGRYIEQGYALGLKRSGEDKSLIICGPRESCFDYLKDFIYYPNIDEMINAFQ